jgi:hypothetical protein
MFDLTAVLKRQPIFPYYLNFFIPVLPQSEQEQVIIK